MHELLKHPRLGTMYNNATALNCCLGCIKHSIYARLIELYSRSIVNYLHLLCHVRNVHYYFAFDLFTSSNPFDLLFFLYVKLFLNYVYEMVCRFYMLLVPIVKITL